MEGVTSYLPIEGTETWKDAKKKEQNTQRKKRGSGIQKEKKRRRITQQEKQIFEKKKVSKTAGIDIKKQLEQC